MSERKKNTFVFSIFKVRSPRQVKRGVTQGFEEMKGPFYGKIARKTDLVHRSEILIFKSGISSPVPSTAVVAISTITFTVKAINVVAISIITFTIKAINVVPILIVSVLFCFCYDSFPLLLPAFPIMVESFSIIACRIISSGIITETIEARTIETVFRL